MFKGKLTKQKVVWHSLVDVNQIKTAIQKLKDINCLHSEVTDESVDEACCSVMA